MDIIGKAFDENKFVVDAIGKIYKETPKEEHKGLYEIILKLTGRKDI